MKNRRNYQISASISIHNFSQLYISNLLRKGDKQQSLLTLHPEINKTIINDHSVHASPELF